MQPATPPPPVHLGTGQKRPTPPAARVTGLDPMAPSRRTPHAGVAALVQEPDRQEPATRPMAVGQAVRATLEGTAVAMARRGERVGPREEPDIQPRVARTDGAEARPPQGVPHVPA